MISAGRSCLNGPQRAIFLRPQSLEMSKILTSGQFMVDRSHQSVASSGGFRVRPGSLGFDQIAAALSNLPGRIKSWIEEWDERQQDRPPEAMLESMG